MIGDIPFLLPSAVCHLSLTTLMLVFFRKPLRIALAMAVIVFLVTSVTSAVIVKYHERKWHSVPLALLYARVGINDSLFVGVAIVLSVCIFKMSKMSFSSMVLEAKVSSTSI